MQRSDRILQPPVWRGVLSSDILPHMLTTLKTSLLLASLVLPLFPFVQDTPTSTNGPRYTSDGQMQLPTDYRQWVYLSTGFDMSYAPGMQMGHHMFDSVFVNPEAYKAFTETGTWPDKTVMVLEVRAAKDKGSINQKGNYQGELMGREVHVKDKTRFQGQGGWAFFGFDEDKPAKMTPTTASCYSCHQEHGAVDTTFVQFYPTLLPIATAKGTLSPSYQKETAQK